MVTFKLCAVSTTPQLPTDMDIEDDRKPAATVEGGKKKAPGSTPVDLEEARQQSAGGQFGRNFRKQAAAAAVKAVVNSPKRKEQSVSCKAVRTEPLKKRAPLVYLGASQEATPAREDITLSPKSRKVASKMKSTTVVDAYIPVSADNKEYWNPPEMAEIKEEDLERARRVVDHNRDLQSQAKAMEKYYYDDLSPFEAREIGLPSYVVPDSDGFFELNWTQADALHHLRDKVRRENYPDEEFNLSPEEEAAFASQPLQLTNGKWLLESLPRIELGPKLVRPIVHMWCTEPHLIYRDKDLFKVLQAKGYTWGYLTHRKDEIGFDALNPQEQTAYNSLEADIREWKAGVSAGNIEEIAEFAAFEVASEFGSMTAIKEIHKHATEQAPAIIDREMEARRNWSSEHPDDDDLSTEEEGFDDDDEDSVQSMSDQNEVNDLNFGILDKSFNEDGECSYERPL